MDIIELNIAREQLKDYMYALGFFVEPIQFVMRTRVLNSSGKLLFELHLCPDLALLYKRPCDGAWVV